MAYADKEKMRKKKKEWNEKNKEKVKESLRKYRQTEKGKKNYSIGRWKHRGIITDDFDTLYEKYLNTNNCEECNIEMSFGVSGDSRCVDHDHETGKVRNILCRVCNVLRG